MTLAAKWANDSVFRKGDKMSFEVSGYGSSTPVKVHIDAGPAGTADLEGNITGSQEITVTDADRTWAADAMGAPGVTTYSATA